VYRPGQPAAVLRRVAAGPSALQPTVLQRMPGLRIEHRAPPPVYRPGAPIVLAKSGVPPVRFAAIQRSLLAAHAAHRSEHNAAVTAALARFSPMRAHTVVAAHPPDDRHGKEATWTYIERVRTHLEAAYFRDRDGESEYVDTALTEYRAELVEAARRAEVQQRASLEALTVFEREATRRPATRDIKTHMFSAEVEGGVPKGLHAYTNGNLPAGVVTVATVGDVNEVHVLVWSKTGAAGKCKWSTMFPKYMPVGMICWYLLNKRLPDDFTTAARPAVPPFAWKAVTVGQSGDTNYPQYGGSEADIRNAIKDSVDSHRSVVASGATKLYLTKGGVEYQLMN